MKAVIQEVKYNKEFTTQKGTYHSHAVKIDGEWCEYVSKSKEQNKFVAGQEAEYTVTEREYQGRIYKKIKPVYGGGGGSNFSRSMKREQSKYSGFAMSYAKDLAVAGIIKDVDDMFIQAQRMLNWMVEQDKKLENG